MTRTQPVNIMEKYAPYWRDIPEHDLISAEDAEVLARKLRKAGLSVGPVYATDGGGVAPQPGGVSAALPVAELLAAGVPSDWGLCLVATVAGTERMLAGVARGMRVHGGNHPEWGEVRVTVQGLIQLTGDRDSAVSALLGQDGLVETLNRYLNA